jgi:hypothetical protein
MFSGNETSSEEHILPRWMQRRFNLSDQTYNLPNATTIKYKYAKIPVAASHNAEFGKIENKISRGVATLQEIYLWAFKIHIGLIYKSSALKVDIRLPASPSFWDVKDFSKEVWLFRALYSVWAKNGRISPNPFGSVIRMKALTPEPSFDLVHNLQSQTIFLQMGDEVLFIALYDHGRLARSNVQEQFEHHRQAIQAMSGEKQMDQAVFTQRVWACESAYFHYRSRAGLSFQFTESSFTLINPFSWPPAEPVDEEELKLFCRSFGLKLEQYNGETKNVYSNLMADDIEALRQESIQ